MNKTVPGNLINDKNVKEQLIPYCIKNAHRDYNYVGGELYKGDILIVKCAEDIIGTMHIEVIDQYLYTEFGEIVDTFPAISVAGVTVISTNKLILIEMIIESITKKECESNVLYISTEHSDGEYTVIKDVNYSEELVQSLTNKLNAKGEALIEVINERFL